MYYAHFKCPYCTKWWPEDCKCDLVAATLAQQLSETKAELVALRSLVRGDGGEASRDILDRPFYTMGWIKRVQKLSEILSRPEAMRFMEEV